MTGHNREQPMSDQYLSPWYDHIPVLNPYANSFYPSGLNTYAIPFYSRGLNPNAVTFYSRGLNPNAIPFNTFTC
jgi:hypothetical protein